MRQVSKLLEFADDKLRGVRVEIVNVAFHFHFDFLLVQTQTLNGNEFISFPRWKAVHHFAPALFLHPCAARLP